MATPELQRSNVEQVLLWDRFTNKYLYRKARIGSEQCSERCFRCYSFFLPITLLVTYQCGEGEMDRRPLRLITRHAMQYVEIIRF